jgi:hypothetical protein
MFDVCSSLNSGHSSGRQLCPLCADSVEKVFLHHRAQIFRALGAALEYSCGGTTSSCDELTGDLGDGPEVTSIGDRRLFCLFAENKSDGVLGLLQHNLPEAKVGQRRW